MLRAGTARAPAAGRFFRHPWLFGRCHWGSMWRAKDAGKAGPSVWKLVATKNQLTAGIKISSESLAILLSLDCGSTSAAASLLRIRSAILSQATKKRSYNDQYRTRSS